MNEEERKAWDTYFSALVGWSMHPGYYRENAEKPSLEECAHIADKMVIIRRTRQITVV